MEWCFKNDENCGQMVNGPQDVSPVNAVSTKQGRNRDKTEQKQKKGGKAVTAMIIIGG